MQMMRDNEMTNHEQPKARIERIGSEVVENAPIPTVSWHSGTLDEDISLALYSDRYVHGDSLAIGLVCIGEDSEDFGEDWSMLTVNISDDTMAAKWCAREGHVIIDTNNNSKELVDALVRAGLIELTGEWARSGFCAYPLAVIPPHVMGGMTGYEETIERVVLEREAKHEAVKETVRESLDEMAASMQDSAARLTEDETHDESIRDDSER